MTDAARVLRQAAELLRQGWSVDAVMSEFLLEATDERPRDQLVAALLRAAEIVEQERG